MTSILHIFTLSYWFSGPSVASSLTRVFWIIFPLACITLGIVLKITKQKNITSFNFKKRVSYRLSNTIICFGVLMLLWFMLRQQQVIFWGYRFWILVIISVTTWYISVLVRKMKKRIPDMELQYTKQKNFYAYLPHHK